MSDTEENDDFMLPVKDEEVGPTNWDAMDSESETEHENIHSNFLASLDKTDRDWTYDINYVPQIHNFDESELKPGFKMELNKDSTPADFFVELFDLQIVEKIAEETNKFAKLNANNTEIRAVKKWRDTNAAELYVFVALLMVMARKRALTIGEYWSTVAALHQPFFSKIMPRDRFISILTRLTFNMNHNQNNMLTKVQPFLDRTRETFKAALVPFQNLRIAESQTELLGQDVTKSYITLPNKTLCINVFVLHDIQTDFIVDLVVHMGSRTSIAESGGAGMSGAVVTTLMEDFFDKGYNLYTDHWYTSPQLFNFLHAKGTNACGTVLPGRIGMPVFGDLILKSDSEYKCADNMMALKWKDRSETVHMLSTMHDASFVALKISDPKRHGSMRPLAFIDYETNKLQVNKADVLIDQVACIKNCIKWHHKIGFHFIDLIFINAHAAYKYVTGKKVSLGSFQLDLITELVERYHVTPNPSKRQPTVVTPVPLRFSGRHYLSKLPKGISQKKRDAYRLCHVCLKSTLHESSKQLTRYMCSDCNVPLCAIPCFKNYHENKHF